MTFFKNNKFLIFLLAVIVSGYIVYNYYPQYLDFLLKPTQREIYKRTLKKTPADLLKFNELEQLALSDSILVNNTHFEYIQTNDSLPFAAGYLLDIALGKTAQIAIASNVPWILEAYDTSNKLLQEAVIQNDTLKLDLRFNKSQTVKIVVQARLDENSQVALIMEVSPKFEFPLSGKGNASIQSFWGASRGGGSRSHEGNDIFAPKGHPAVAAVNGIVSSVRNLGLGGKQVWLRDDDTGYSLYYAHLDDWNVKENQRVKRGDTLGFVGNTGNARTTPPHLHFGIYTSSGAIDPKPFIWKMDKATSFSIPGVVSKLQTFGKSANLRLQPSSDGQVRKLLSENVTVTVLGTLSQWYHVRTQDGITGYLHRSVVK